MIYPVSGRKTKQKASYMPPNVVARGLLFLRRRNWAVGLLPHMPPKAMARDMLDRVIADRVGSRGIADRVGSRRIA